MTQPNTPDTTDDFNNGQPYCLIAGELLADAVALMTIVRERRPETAAFGDVPVITIDLQTRRIMVGLSLPDDKIAVVEQIDVDPSHPAEFGASSLPIAVADYGEPN